MQETNNTNNLNNNTIIHVWNVQWRSFKTSWILTFKRKTCHNRKANIYSSKTNKIVYLLSSHMVLYSQQKWSKLCYIIGPVSIPFLGCHMTLHRKGIKQNELGPVSKKVKRSTWTLTFIKKRVKSSNLFDSTLRLNIIWQEIK